MEEKSDPPGERPDTQEEGVLAAYSRKTTVHGLQYILCPAVGTIRRIIWGTVFVIFLLLFIYNLYTHVAYFMSYPTSAQTRTILADKVPFPTVTICSQSPIKMTTVAKIGAYSPTATGDWEDAISKANLNISKVAVNAGTVLSNLVLSCQFRGTACAPADWTPSLTSLGKCYTLTPPSGQTSSGEYAGLRLILNSESYEVTNELGGAPGVKIFLHSSSDLPVLGENGISVQPGYDLAGQLSLQKSLRLPPPNSNCDVNAASKDHSCRTECLIQTVKMQCGCLPYYIAGNSVCATSSQLDCSRPVINKFLTGPTEAPCRCPIPCVDTEFSVQATFSPLPETTISKQLSAGTKSNITAAFNAAKALSTAQLPDALTYSDNIINVELYYKSLRYTEDMQMIAYDMAKLFTDIGLILLIWFGMSVMSLYELIDLAFVAIARCCGKDPKMNYA